MDSPPALEDPRPWLAMGQRLAAAGIHVPAVHATDLEQGFLLIEDLGTQLYLPALNDDSADRLYGDAMDALLLMQTRMDHADLPLFDHARLVSGLEVMPEWFLGKHLGHTPTCDEWDVLEAAFGVIIRNALEQPRRFVHRDYHSRNLLIVDHNNPGVIDFQGALSGPITYDLASLLRDAYIVWPRERVEGWVESYRQRLLTAGVIDEKIDVAALQANHIGLFSGNLETEIVDVKGRGALGVRRLDKKASDAYARALATRQGPNTAVKREFREAGLTKRGSDARLQ